MVQCLCTYVVTAIQYSLSAPIDPPQIDFPDEGFIYSVNETDDIMFFCNATGLPAPTVWFTRNGATLMIGDGMGRIDVDNAFMEGSSMDEQDSIQLDSGTFLVSINVTIANTIDGDSGNYSCEASSTVALLNTTLRDSHTFQLIVQSEYIILHALHSVQCLSKGSFELISLWLHFSISISISPRNTQHFRPQQVQ